jgi:hypothetical protein
MTRQLLRAALLTATLIVPGAARPAAADVRLQYGSALDVPDVHPGAPIYWRPMPEVFSAPVPGDQKWVAQIFYRPPECAGDFNLLNFFDIPDAWFCPLLMDGFGVFPDPLGLPRQSLLMGDEVPIWFVSTEDYESAIDDGKLTVAELCSLPSIQYGVADFYVEVLQPLDGPAEVPKLELLAIGQLEDGRTFSIQFIEGANGTDVLEISIEE